MYDMRSEAKSDPNPVLIHCSAGIGRTGTAIAFDHAMYLLKEQSKVNLIDIIRNIREDRCAMIQHVQQYEFFHEACVKFGNVRNHPLVLNVDLGKDADAAVVDPAQLEAMRHADKLAAQERAKAAAKQPKMISTAQIDGELRMDLGEVQTEGGEVCAYLCHVP